MDKNRQFDVSDKVMHPRLPSDACLCLNRCSLPAALLGSLTYQAHPIPLELDGIRALHSDLFDLIDALSTPADRAQRFMDYMNVHFRLEHLDEAGLNDRHRGRARPKANYLRMVRGWSFSSEGREGAVLKNWVETRFGLLARYHGEPLGDHDSDARDRFMHQAAAGIYATNAIEAQLDLLYTYCQYELARQYAARDDSARTVTLYRGVNRLSEHEVLEKLEQGRYRVLLNNLSSFTASRERADEFGDHIMAASVPLPKVFFYNQLLPGRLKGEDEFVVIGGLYAVLLTSA